MNFYKDLFLFILQIVLIFVSAFCLIIAFQYVVHFLGLVWDWALAPINGGLFQSEIK